MSYAETNQLCSERHEKIKETLKEHNDILNKHSDDISELQQMNASRTAEVSNMCRSIESLNQRIDKIIGQNRNLLITVITILVGFILNIFEKGLFK